MIYESYSNKMYGKLESANKAYSKLVYKKVGELENTERFDTEEHLRSVPTEGWKPLENGAKWGGEWQNMWVRGKAIVPASAAGKKLYVLPRTGAVEILYFLDGKPYGIINSKHGDFIGGNHAAQQITPCAKAGETFEVALECYAGHYCAGTQPFDSYGADVVNYDKGQFDRNYNGVEIAVLDEDIWHFVFDLKAVQQMARVLPASDFLRNDAREVLEKVYSAIVQFPYDYPEETWHASLIAARELMRPLLEKSGNEKTRGKVGIIGHSHMDTAWLWPVSETVRKCARTYSNALHLMELYPEYKFVQSSALHLDWMRRYYPTIFEDIKQRCAEGRYEPNGGVWVECDCNITSGELMVRQFLRGQLFTRKYLNFTSDCFWLPDTFGYNAAIPQIMQESGVKYFYTTKLGWGDMNNFPYDTFMWKGIDGTGVLTHFNQIHCFPDVETSYHAVEGIKNKTVYDGKLLSFGFGDGGGGPTPGMLEDARRVSDMAGLPKMEYTTISDFMKDIESRSRDLPVFNGELYLECHRGTLTQMHDIKRNNRKAEFALHDMEYMNTLARAPKNECSGDLYDVLLKNQFHDILPGTSLACVNDLARKQVTEVIDSAKAESAKYATSLTDGDKGSVTVFNTLSFDRSGVIALPGAAEGKKCQTVTDVCGHEYTLADAGTLPAFGAVSVKLGAPCKFSDTSAFTYKSDTLETPFAIVKFDENGFISSLWDKNAEREVAREGGYPLGVFHIADDVPGSWDNWDLDYDLEMKYREDAKLVSRKVVGDGALEFRIRSKYTFGQRSSLTQDMIFHSNSARIDYQTLVDWKEKHTILKAGFDVNILAPTVKNEIQFGHIDRPTTRNNTIEAAKFEVCNHKWTDISENRFGVAVLNDCKYGISVFGGDLRLTLHRGGCRPDVTGDEGVHEMTYSLLPHEGVMCAESVIRPAYELNVPVVTATGALKAPVVPIASISASNVICETVKPAELVEKAYVLRLYEAERSAVTAKITLPSDVKHAYVTNMLEDVKYELDIKDGSISLKFKPFQIITVMLQM